jgi:hypothetical protein
MKLQANPIRSIYRCFSSVLTVIIIASAGIMMKIRDCIKSDAGSTPQNVLQWRRIPAPCKVSTVRDLSASPYKLMELELYYSIKRNV